MTEPSTPPAPTPRRSRAGLIIAAIVAAAVLIGGTVAVMLALDNDGDTTTANSNGGDTFTMVGSMLLEGRGLGNSFIYSDNGCQGIGGYDDIRAGTDVTVYDPAGVIVATGELAARSSVSGGGCTYPFRVDGVPSGLEFYSVEVSRRGKVTVDADEATRSVRLTLG